jgi:AraC-like DNA-binding protein
VKSHRKVQQNYQIRRTAGRYTSDMRTLKLPNPLFAHRKRTRTLLRQARAVALHTEQCIALLGPQKPLNSNAQSPHYCASHLRALHQRLTGESVANARRRYRLDCAAVHLLRTNTAVCVIAETAGYASQAAFSRAFAARFGATPAAIRRHGPPALWAKPLTVGLAFSAFASSQSQGIYP